MTLTAVHRTRIAFTPLSYAHAASAGRLRQAANVRDGLRDAYGFSGDGYAAHELGALGEAAVAKYLGVYWDVGVIGTPDVGGYQVRTRSQPWHDLILHPADDDEAAHILVVKVGAMAFEIVGWAWGYEAKRARYWREYCPGRPAYFTPQAMLRPMEELPR